MTNNEIFAFFFADTEIQTMFNLPFLLCKECYFKQMKLVEYSGRLVMEEISRQLWVLEDNYDTKI
jgi:hypothetical protein